VIYTFFEVMNHAPFIIINLLSQSIAVGRYVKGWPKDEILQWLVQRGQLTVYPLPPLPNNISNDIYYEFISRLGFSTNFFLDDDQFTFILQHTTYQPKLD
jgi:hypothetical protein